MTKLSSSSQLADHQYYYKQSLQYPLLSQKEEEELAKRIKKGDAAARTEFVQANLRLVVSIALRCTKNLQSTTTLDLIQIGNIGAMKAVGKFDHTRGLRFSTYGVWWVRESILREIDYKDRLVHIPRLELIKKRKYKRLEEQLYKTLGRDPLVREIAPYLEISTEETHALREISSDTYSLESTPGDDEAEFPRNLVPDTALPIEESYFLNERKEMLRKALATLPKVDREVMEMYYGFLDGTYYTWPEVGNKFNLTIGSLRQIQVNALAKLRGFAAIKDLKD